MATDTVIESIEREIDETFETSDLLDLGYAQAMWTLLSVNEDAYLTYQNRLPDEAVRAFVDTRINAMTYPLRACLKRSQQFDSALRREIIDDHYRLAWEWLALAKNYSQFCSMFPLWRRGRIKLSVFDNRLHVDSSFNNDKSYEAYNRLIHNEGRSDSAMGSPDDGVIGVLMSKVTAGDNSFRVNFNQALVSKLVLTLRPILTRQHTLPNDWQFGAFSLKQYREVLLTLQSMLYGWHFVRRILVGQGMPGLGYPSSVWVLPVPEVGAHLKQFTGIPRRVIARILDLITFGSNDIREPDIATQPLVDLKNGFYALSPFLFLNINVERNLCTLLNQIPTERAQYMTLVHSKEFDDRPGMRSFLTPLNLEFEAGEVKGTDVDVAIVDRARKVCLCLELKWFIEPAEIREVEDRTKELLKGVAQAKKIDALFNARDETLLSKVLKISDDYTFLSAVASVNWIGFGDVQDPAVPIVKVWHLLSYLKATGSLADAIDWLTNRRYLPQAIRDYSVEPLEISCGKWSATWYGIKPSRPDAQPILP